MQNLYKSTMFDQPIKDILARRLQPLPTMVMEKNLRSDIDDLLVQCFAAGRVVVVDDMNTAAAYGDHIFRAIKSRYDATHITLPYGVKADEEALIEIERRSAKADMLIAVGGGTISDLTKYASHKAGKPYVMIPTAASMNGYVSRNASITIAGKKESHMAQLPLAVFVDMGVIAAAPLRLAQAGLGDSLARPTAQADWLLSHFLVGTAYDAEVYQLIAPYEPMVFEQSKALLSRDTEVLSSLMKLLFASGFGMTIANSSAPASGAEHMIAHMLSQSGNLHGEEIAVTAVAMAERQAKLLIDRPWRMVESKKEMPSQYACDAAREAINTIHIASEKLVHIRATAGLPERIETLGWDKEAYAHALAHAHFTRDRFTCLNISG